MTPTVELSLLHSHVHMCMFIQTDEHTHDHGCVYINTHTPCSTPKPSPKPALSSQFPALSGNPLCGSKAPRPRLTASYLLRSQPPLHLRKCDQDFRCSPGEAPGAQSQPQTRIVTQAPEENFRCAVVSLILLEYLRDNALIT